MPEDFVVEPPTEAEQATLERQRELELHLPELGVAVVGCGGVGSWIAYFLALAGVHNLWLFDPDTLSETNLNRILLPRTAIGKRKSEALADHIKLLRPSCNAIAMSRFDAETANTMRLGLEINWLVASTDTWASRREAFNWSRDMSISYIEAAAEGEFGSIAAQPAEWATAEEDHPGYASVPVWVGPCVSAAMMAVAYIIHNNLPQRDLSVRIGWDGSITYFNSLEPRPSTRDTPQRSPGTANAINFSDFIQTTRRYWAEADYPARAALFTIGGGDALSPEPSDAGEESDDDNDTSL